MTSSALAESPAAVRGDQRPRILWRPPSVSSAGVEAVELAASAGLVLDPWEAFVLEVALAERADGNWAAFEVGLLVSRQNGKGAILEARELAGLYLFGERLLLHSAHEFKTCLEGFRRVLGLIENTDHLRRRVRRVRTSHGEEAIELLGEGRTKVTGGQRLLFVARTGGSGRGFSGDCNLLDEAFHLSDTAAQALLPTVSARPNPQIWYTFSAPDRDLAPCEVVARLRRRALAGGDASLAYLEWSIDPHTEFCAAGCVDHDDPGAPRSWARANPGLGIRISAEHVARERASMSAEGFARERLGIGNWPADGAGWQVISQPLWAAALDPASQAGSPLAFAADVTPERSYASIAVAGRRGDGKLHVEVIDHRARTDWVVGRLLELAERWRPCALVVDAAGPAGSLIAPLEAAGVEVVKPTAREMGQACGQLYDAAVQGDLRHLDQPPLQVALAGAQRRPLGDAWAWARKTSTVDISPLVAVTLAAWGHATRAHLGANYDVLDSAG